jgi:hypothetical protein
VKSSCGDPKNGMPVRLQVGAMETPELTFASLYEMTKKKVW